MILHRDGASRREEAVEPVSVPEIGRFLRRERTQQGLSVPEVSAAMGVPADSLEALEAGTVDRLPDRIHTVKVLRRYADFLGLPGAAYALVLIEHWPSSAAAAAVVNVHAGAPLHPASWPAGPSGSVGNPDDTATIPAVGARWALPGTGDLPVGGHGAAPATGATPATGAVASTGVGLGVELPGGSITDGGGEDPPTAQVPRVFDETGPLPVIGMTPQERSGGSLVLRVLVTVLALALVVGIAGIVVNRVRPQWLQKLGITTSPTSAPTTTTTAPGSTTTTSPDVFTQVSATSGSATFAVRAKSFEVTVSAVGSATWVSATLPGSSDSLFAGIVQAGDKQPFTVHQQGLALEIGSSAARVAVTVGNQPPSNYVPPAAPFSMTFRSTG
ncbi:MAG TPA: helix-turn-helix transcriptional regulator [Acidimicrobiales bacterium]